MPEPPLTTSSAARLPGGPYTQVAAPTTNSDTDTAVTNGTAYYYVVSAVNSYGESANSSEVSATPTAPATIVHVTVDVLTNRHPISPYVYGGAFPKDGPTISDSNLSTVRWGVTPAHVTTGLISTPTRLRITTL